LDDWDHLREFGFEEGSVRAAVLLCEANRRSDIEVVLEASNMQHD
jgi:hypothetical protein